MALSERDDLSRQSVRTESTNLSAKGFMSGAWGGSLGIFMPVAFKRSLAEEKSGSCP